MNAHLTSRLERAFRKLPKIEVQRILGDAKDGPEEVWTAALAALTERAEQ